jgi:hypothetical protein
VEALRDDHDTFDAKDLPRTVAAVVGAATGVVKYDVILWDAQAQGIVFHRLRFVVVDATVVAAAQQLLDFARPVELNAREDTVGQNRREGTVGP